MKFGYVIFNGMTALDFVGALEPVARLKTMGFIPDLVWDLCAVTKEVTDSLGQKYTPTTIGRPLNGFKVVVVPGGITTRDLIHDGKFVEWIRTAKDSDLIASVCTGSLLLGAAGLLDGKTATTHPNAYELLQSTPPKSATSGSSGAGTSSRPVV